MVRRNKTLDALFELVATAREIAEVDYLYSQGKKGVAVHKQIRKVYVEVSELLKHKKQTIVKEDEFDIPKLRCFV